MKLNNQFPKLFQTKSAGPLSGGMELCQPITHSAEPLHDSRMLTGQIEINMCNFSTLTLFCSPRSLVHIIEQRIGTIVFAEQFPLPRAHREIRQVADSIKGIPVGRASPEEEGFFVEAREFPLQEDFRQGLAIEAYARGEGDTRKVEQGRNQVDGGR